MTLAADIASCALTAPNDGMVVYYSREGSKLGAGSQRRRRASSRDWAVMKSLFISVRAWRA